MLFREFSNDQVMDYEESRLPEKYPEFRYIYQEYHDGILLFDIMDQQVWSKAVSDTLGLEAFHEGLFVLTFKLSAAVAVFPFL